MIALPLVALIAHLGLIAAMAPGVELPPDALPWLTAAQFPLMGVTAAVHGVAADRELDRLQGWCTGSFGLGVTCAVMVLLIRYDVSVGPADPYGAPPDSSPEVALAWYAGFSAIAAVGHTMFIGKPILKVADRMLAPLRRRVPNPAIAAAALVATGLGVIIAVVMERAP